MLEDNSTSELEIDAVNIYENSLKYLCIECKYVTVSKELMDKHVHSKHQPNENEDVKSSWHDFCEAETYDAI